MQEIGGYFGLELNHRRQHVHMHPRGIFLNSGKNALEYVLMALPAVQKIKLPYYTCEVVLEPIIKLGIPYEFYHIDDQFEIANDIVLEPNEYLIVNNYFGIKDHYINGLISKYGSQLIVDNAQALYAKHTQNIRAIYSPRKFIGIPDGGIAYISHSDMAPIVVDQEISHDHCAHLLKRWDIGASMGYEDFKQNGETLLREPVKFMSCLSQAIFQSVDTEFIRKTRRENFKILHDELGATNGLCLPYLGSFECPLIYPYFTRQDGLKDYLIQNKVFVATYWPNVFKWCTPQDFEYQLADGMIAIPIDQRYGENEMRYIIKLIKNYEA